MIMGIVRENRQLLRRCKLMVVQAVVLAACQVVAYWLRFELSWEALEQPNQWTNLYWTLGIQLVCIEVFDLSCARWRYVSLKDLLMIVKAMTCAFVIIFLIRVFVPGISIPRGVILIDYMLSLLSLSFLRVLVRLFNERSLAGEAASTKRRALIVGAGNTGAAMAKQALSHPEANMIPVGFVDDDEHLLGLQVNGVPVLGTIEDIAKVAELSQATEVCICMPTATGAETRRAVQMVVDAGLHARILPSIHQVLEGHVRLDLLREVEITDLLGREPVKIDSTAVSKLLRGKRVLVTGAGGSIGSELCRQVLEFAPESLVIVDRAEPLLFRTEQELLKMKKDDGLAAEVHVTPADVGDRSRMDEIFRTFKPQIVCHAAAHKHVPMMESNPGEAVRNNVFGTRCLAETAVKHNVEMFVMISTDKAVNPTSVMGATKRIAEIMVQALARRSQTAFVTVRFGNVLGSSGSVIPIFREQIRNGGPVTVTHPDMKRYFMLIPEAVELVLQAAAFGRGGHIFVLDMGEPVVIADMARELIRISGLKPDIDIAIKFTGLRPGEKLFEELRLEGESYEKTPHERIRVVKAMECNWEELMRLFKQLEEAVAGGNHDTLRAAIRGIVPEYVHTPSGVTPSTRLPKASDPKVKAVAK
jgi:FlaA1/EpsC-like NDP-sugar epimerase